MLLIFAHIGFPPEIGLVDSLDEQISLLGGSVLKMEILSLLTSFLVFVSCSLSLSEVVTITVVVGNLSLDMLRLY